MQRYNEDITFVI